MNDFLKEISAKASRTVKYWWLKLVAGILLIAMGVVVFFYPGESYMALVVFFGIAILISGIVQISMAIASPSYFTSRGWLIAGGILDIILGIILCSNLVVSAITIPFIVGIWALYRGIMTINFSSDMSMMHIPGSGWSIFFGVILILLSLMILFQPFSIGVPAVVVLLGVSFIMMGCTYIYISCILKRVHKFFDKEDK